jgi:hypothetical protein
MRQQLQEREQNSNISRSSMPQTGVIADPDEAAHEKRTKTNVLATVWLNP